MLLERGREVTAIHERLAAARAGHGSVVAIEAGAGLGKTRLLTAASERAGADGMNVLSARCSELERPFTFGALRQLYEPLLGPDERRRLTEPADGAADPLFAVAHSIYWLTAEQAAARPLLIALDDAQWADTASLGCLAYLARRIAELPVMLIATIRTGEPDTPAALLGALTGEASERLAPRPLSRAAVAELVEELMGERPSDDFSAAAHDLTAGNPFLLGALVAQLREDGVRPDAAGAARLPQTTPEAVARSVLVRLGRLGDEPARLVQAVAVLGDGAALVHAAELAGLDPDAAAAAADRLAQAEVLGPGPRLEFSHPLVRAAVHSEIASYRRASMHAGAARLLDAAGASAEHVGAQLLRAAPAADPWAADRLAAAGHGALARGDLDGAIAFFGRALEEGSAAGDRARLLHALGGAEVRAGNPAGYGHIEEAAALADDAELRAAIGFDHARGLLLSGRPEAVAALEQVSALLPPGERGETIRKEAELIALGRMSPQTAPLVAARAAALAPVVEAGDPGWEAALGVLAGNAYLDCEPAERVADLARRSLAGRDARGEDPAESAGYLDSCYVLMCAGDVECAIAHLDRAVTAARAAGSLIGFAAAASFRAAAWLRRGDLRRADADAQMALEAAAVSLAPLPLPATVGVLVFVLTERGEFDAAEALLAEHGFAGELMPLGPFNDLAFARGRMRLLAGRPAEALTDLVGAGESARALGIKAPGPFPWRPAAARALHALDRHAEAAELAAEGVEVARRFGAPRDLGAALLAAGLIRRDHALLEEAVAVLEPSAAALELARARTELGAALRRSGHRERARAVLREALDGAAGCGATALAERARRELVTAGARPRRERTAGVDALTASERRVAELAVEGLTNRQIAEALFVSTGTVEKHLASAYMKLEIGGRRDLAGALA